MFLCFGNEAVLLGMSFRKWNGILGELNARCLTERVEGIDVRHHPALAVGEIQVVGTPLTFQGTLGL